MNPEKTGPQSKPHVPRCKTCGDFGYTLPPEIDFRDAIPAGILFAIGEPCTCSFGPIFAAHKAQWEIAIPNTRGSLL